MMATDTDRWMMIASGWAPVIISGWLQTGSWVLPVPSRWTDAESQRIDIALTVADMMGYSIRIAGSYPARYIATVRRDG